MTIRETAHYVEVAGTSNTGNVRTTRQYVDIITVSSSEVRVTRQYADILTGVGDSEIRLTRQYVDVLVPTTVTVNVSANSTISFTQIASAPKQVSVNSALGISDVAAGSIPGPVPVSASSNLGISHDGHTDATLFLDTSSTIIFDSILNRTIFLEVGNLFNVQHTHIIVWLFEDRRPVENVLNFSSVATSTSFPEVTQNLNLDHTLFFAGPKLVSAANSIPFQHSTRNTAPHVYATTFFYPNDKVNVNIPLDVSNTLVFISDANITTIRQELHFIQHVLGAKSTGVEHHFLGITDAVSFIAIWNKVVVQDLGIGHAFTYFEDTPCNRKNYTPFTGENTIPNASEAPGIFPEPTRNVTENRFMLYYPSLGPRTEMIVLRAPDFGNRFRDSYTRVNQETRGGKLLVFNDPIWPKIKTLVVTIVGLKKTDVDSFQSFLLTYLGMQIGLIDWEGTEWIGVITDPNQPAVQDGKEQWTITFTFEGERVPPPSPDNVIEVDQVTVEVVDPPPTGFVTFNQDAQVSIDPGSNAELELSQALRYYID